MDGTPFEFNEFAQRYEYYEIDKTNFKRVQSISAFVKGFPQAEQSDENYRDIFIRNISVYSALKMYDSSTDDYVVKVLTPSGTLFGLDNSVTELPFEALFTVRGNEVAESQNAQYYWAKKNVDVNSVGDSKYLNYFGTGWQCLNKSEVTKTDKSTITEEDLKNCIIDSTDYPAGYVGILKWVNKGAAIFSNISIAFISFFQPSSNVIKTLFLLKLHSFFIKHSKSSRVIVL